MLHNIRFTHRFQPLDSQLWFSKKFNTQTFWSPKNNDSHTSGIVSGVARNGQKSKKLNRPTFGSLTFKRLIWKNFLSQSLYSFKIKLWFFGKILVELTHDPGLTFFSYKKSCFKKVDELGELFDNVTNSRYDPASRDPMLHSTQEMQFFIQWQGYFSRLTRRHRLHPNQYNGNVLNKQGKWNKVT